MVFQLNVFRPFSACGCMQVGAARRIVPSSFDSCTERVPFDPHIDLRFLAETFAPSFSSSSPFIDRGIYNICKMPLTERDVNIPRKTPPAHKSHPSSSKLPRSTATPTSAPAIVRVADRVASAEKAANDARRRSVRGVPDSVTIRSYQKVS